MGFSVTMGPQSSYELLFAILASLNLSTALLIVCHLSVYPLSNCQLSVAEPFQLLLPRSGMHCLSVSLYHVLYYFQRQLNIVLLQ